MLLPQKKNRTEAEQKEKDGSFQGSKAQSGGGVAAPASIRSSSKIERPRLGLETPGIRPSARPGS